MDDAIREEARLVSIWVKSSREAFPPQKLNTAALEPYEKWLEKAFDIIEKGSSAESSENFTTWKKEIDRSLQQLSVLREKGTDPEKSEPVHVSIRGFVKKRGIYFIGCAGRFERIYRAGRWGESIWRADPNLPLSRCA